GASRRRRPVTNHSPQKIRLRIEVEGGQQAARSAALNDEVILVINDAIQSVPPIGESCLDLPGEGDLRLQAEAVQFFADDFVLGKQPARRFPPAGFAVERPDAFAAFRMIFKTDRNGALIRRLRVDREFAFAAEAAVALAGTGG